MATRMTQAMMARTSRRLGGIDQLAKVYKQQVESLNDQYASDFGAYQQRVKEQTAPFEAAMQQYRDVAAPQYQTQVDEYNAKLADYRAKLTELEADPVTERRERVKVGRTWYGKSKYEDFVFFDPKPIPTFDAKAPELPDVPQAPEIEKFDSQVYDRGTREASGAFQREVGERRASRLNATRRSSRTMLGGRT